jgi:hypothetical protein
MARPKDEAMKRAIFDGKRIFGKNKYGAKKVREDGHVFDSQMEHRRYLELKLMAAGKQVSDLTVHPRFPLTVNGFHVATYEGDFSYREPGNPKLVCEDTKGFVTPEFRIKARLFMALYPHADFRVLGAKPIKVKKVAA